MSLRRRTQPQTGPWTPSRLGGALQLWLDATDSTTLTTTASSVSQWRDKSSYGNNASQATAALQPTLTSTAINGLPALSLSSDQLDIPSLVLTGQGYTFFAAATMTTSTASNGRLLAAKAAGVFGDAFDPTSWTILMRSGTSANLTAVHNSVQPTNIGSVSYSTPFIVDSELNAGVRIFINGTAAGSSATSSDLNTTAGVRIGNDMEGGAQYWNGLVGEIICGKNLGDAEKQLVRGYLAWKWGTTASLPSDHPYKTNSSLFIIPPYTIPLVSYNFQDSTAADGTNANGGTLTNVGSGGSALNGTIQQCTWQQGYSGRGLGFAPRSAANSTLIDRILTVANPALNLTTGATITCWYKNNATTFDQGILGGLFSGEDNIFTLWARGSGANTNVVVYVNSQFPVGTTGLVNWGFSAGSVTNIQNWNHYAVSYQSTGPSTSGVLRIYINGVLRTTLNSATSAEYAQGDFSYTGNLRFVSGAPVEGFSPPGYGLDGSLDDVRLYSTALTAAEIAAIASSPPYTIPLVSYNFNDSTAADGTNANGGTLTNVGSGGSALNGTIQQCTWQQGYSGRGLRFAPRSAANSTLTDRILTPTNPALNLTTGGTIMLRARCTDTVFREYGPFGLAQSDDNDRFIFELKGVGGTNFLRAYFISSTTQTWAIALGPSDLVNEDIRSWNHYAITYQSGSGRIYVNGVLKLEDTSVTGSLVHTGDLKLSLGWFSIGHLNPNNGGFNGDIDDFRLYSTALTAAEIAAIASS